MSPTALAAWIVNYQALAAAVLLVALLAGLLVRQPARRAALDWATLAGLLALAVLSALPGWPRVALFEQPVIVQTEKAPPPVVNVAPREAPVVVRQAPPRDFRPQYEPVPQRAMPPIAAPRPPVSPPVATPPKPAPWQWSDLAAPLAYGFAAGIVVVAAWLLWGAIESWRLVRRASLPTDDLLAELAVLASGKPPRLLVSRDVSAAAALGALRPTILVTPQLAAAPAEVVRAVLAHELAHLRHGDLWFLALGRAGLLLLYPQPCYWWLRRRAADSREALADAAAAGSSERTQYAELLVAAARTLSDAPRRGPALAILERPSQLGRRVKLLLDPGGAIELRSTRRWRWLGAAAATAVVLAASLVQVMPAAVGQDDSKDVPSPRSHLLDYVILEPSEGGTDLERAAAAVARARFAPNDSAATSPGKAKTWPKTVRPPRMIAVPGEGYPPGGWSAYRKDQSPYLSERTPGIIYGDVADDQDRPLAGVRVRYWTPQQEREVITDSTGRYTFDGVDEREPLKYVEFTKEGFSPQVTIGPRRGGQIDARLTNRFYFTGKVRDPQGHAVAGAQVRASYMPTIEGLDVEPIHFEAFTDAEGNYKLFVSPEPYDVTVTKPGPQPNLQSSTRANGRGTKQLDFQLAAAEPSAPSENGAANAEPEPAAQAYRPVEPDSSGGLTYQGLVVDSKTGKPVEGATVFVARMAASGEDYKLLERTEHRSDQAGKYQFTIPREQAEMRRLLLTVDAEHPQYAKRTLGGYGLGLIRKNEQFGSPPFYSRIELLPGVEVTGGIEDPQGKPVPNLEVQYFSVDPDGGDPLFTNSRSQGSVRTDANGRFKFNALRGGESTLWVAPSSAIAPGNLASKTMYLGKRTGDVGPIRVEPGQQLTGRVQDAEGAPMPSVWVHASSMEPVFLGSAEGRRDQRDAQTNERGEFSLAALPPGKYQVSVVDRNWGAPFGDQPISPLRAVFKRQVVELADKAAAPLEFKAVPQFTLEAQWVDSSGQPTTGHSAMVTGKWDGEHFATQGTCDDKGHVVAVIPQGMTEVRFEPSTSEHSSLRMRRGKDGPLLDESNLDLGTPTEDVRDLFLVRYQAPIVVVRAKDAVGRPIKDFRPRIDYRNTALRKDPRSRWVSGVEGDVLLEQAPDGNWRSSGLRTDEEISVGGAAPGFRAASRDLKLPEGQNETVEFVLEPLAPGEAESKDARARPQPPATYYNSRVYRPVEPDATGSLTYRAQIVDRDTGMPVEGAKVVVNRLDLSTRGLRTASGVETTTDDVGEFSFTLSAAEVAKQQLFLAFDVQKPGYVQQEFAGGELSSIRSRELMGLAPEFRKLELAPGEPIFGQVVSPTGQPMAGLAVNYLTMSPDAHGSSEGTRTESKTTTDTEGRFRFAAVRGGLTRLWVEPAEYAPRTLLLGKRTGDVGRIELQTGKQLTGTLLDAEGRPVPNAWVKVGPKTYPFVQRMSGDQSQRTAKTDANGRFALAPLAPGEYQASVSGRDWSNVEALEAELLVPAVFLAQLVTVGADAPTSDVTLRAVPHVRVEVKCVDEAGKPADASRFAPLSGLEGKMGDVLVYYKATLEGTDKLTLLAPRGLINANLFLGYTADGTIYTRRGAESAWAVDRNPRFDTLDHDVEDVYFTFKASPTVLVQAVDLEGKPIPKARPRVDYPSGLLGVQGPRRWESGIEGQAMLALQPDGGWRSYGLMPDQEFTLTMQAPGYRSKNQVLKLAPGKTEQVTLRLEPAPPGETTIELTPEPEGEPLFRTEVDLGAMEDESVTKGASADDKEPDEGRDAEGFRLVWSEAPMEEEAKKKEEPGDKAPAGSANGDEAKSSQNNGGKSEASQPYSIKTYEAASEPTQIEGVVTDEHGQPLPGVKVDVWHWREGNETATDAAGRYELSGFEPHELLEIVFTKEGLSPLLRADLKAGTVLDVKLDDKTSIVGTVRDPAGQPVQGALVRASYASTVGDWFIVPFELEATTDAEGRYRLLTSPGTCDLWARKPGVGIAQRAFVLTKPGDTEAIDLQLEPGVRFEARLRDSVTGKPVAGAKFESQFADVTATSDANGLIALDALPQVQIAFDVEAPGYARWWSRQTSIPSDHDNPARAGQWQDDTGHLRFELFSDRVSVEIELEPAAKVRGRVVDPNGVPVPDCSLAAISGKSYSVVDTRFTTDAAGRFEFPLPASGAVEYFLVGHDGTWHTSRNWANGYANPIRTKPGQIVGEIELQLTRGATIRGQVVDGLGQPVEGKTVIARAKQNGGSTIFAPRAKTDAEGRFELKNVESGSNTIMLGDSRAPEDAAPESWRQIEVQAGKDQNEIRLIAEPEQEVIDSPFFRTYPARPVTEEEATEKAAEVFRPDALPRGPGEPRLLWDEKPTKKK